MGDDRSSCRGHCQTDLAGSGEGATMTSASSVEGACVMQLVKLRGADTLQQVLDFWNQE